jgi:hypothetical protein
MFITAVKTAIAEALDAGFNAINVGTPSDTSIDLTPNSITIEYPLELVAWPTILIHFRATKVQWHGLQPDVYSVAPSGITISGVTYSGTNVDRSGYFEGNIDLQIMAMHSEERDRLMDSVANLILMGHGSAASTAFYQSILNNSLVGLTLLPSTYTSLGDSISAGTPWSPEELTYEASMRISCIGDFYATKYDYVIPQITNISTSGTPYYPSIASIYKPGTPWYPVA